MLFGWLGGDGGFPGCTSMHTLNTLWLNTVEQGGTLLPCCNPNVGISQQSARGDQVSK